MKANAPEKLYFNQHTAQHNHERRNDDDIEYIRKDVFIEKAINWLRKELINFEEPVDTEKTFINDFKKAMEE